jgi:hypothetical protein
MPNLVVKEITIDTEAIPNEEGKTVNVSSMEIVLEKQTGFHQNTEEWWDLHLGFLYSIIMDFARNVSWSP